MTGWPWLMERLTSRAYGSTDTTLWWSASSTSSILIPMSGSTLLRITDTRSVGTLSRPRVSRNTLMLRMLGRSRVAMQIRAVDCSSAVRVTSESWAEVSTTM